METCLGFPEQHLIGQSGPQFFIQLSGQLVSWVLLCIKTAICFGKAAQHLTGQSGPHVFMQDAVHTP